MGRRVLVLALAWSRPFGIHDRPADPQNARTVWIIGTQPVIPAV